MKPLTVAVPADVRAQIQRQMLYIAQDSIDNALAWEDRVMTAIFGLGDFHGHALDTDMGTRLGYAIHKLVYEGTYLIHYRVDETAGIVTVVQFRHGARLPRV